VWSVVWVGQEGKAQRGRGQENKPWANGPIAVVIGGYEDVCAFNWTDAEPEKREETTEL
jgi:hypothetical protein